MSTYVTFVIFGASGDLTRRLLLPGLGTLLKQRPGLHVNVIGAAREDILDSQWKELVNEALAEGGCEHECATRTSVDSAYYNVDVTDEAALRDLLGELPDGDPVVLYFALPPSVSFKACQVLAKIGVDDNVRLALEKPFGSSAETAQEFNELLASFVPEERVFRVDHFLGRATVLNLLALRFGNRVFSRAWSRDDIERIDITYDESLALEGRAGYYDKAGALRDMLQSHLLLVMGMLMMEDPHRINHIEVRDEITSMLRATHLWGDDPRTAGVRGRYTAGTINGKEIPNYVDEPGVDPGAGTETFAQLTLEVRDHRWAGVPVSMRSGKAMAESKKQIAITFKPVAHLPEGFECDAIQDVLVIGLKPEFLEVTLTTNSGPHSMSLGATTMSAELGSSPLRPYGEIMGHIIDGDPLLTVRADTAEECWRIVDPVLEAWAKDEVPMHEYEAGSSGPEAANLSMTDFRE